MALDDSPSHHQSQPAGAFNPLPPIASIWRRLGAFLLDSILLGILGQIIGLSLAVASVAFQMGPYARFIGWAVILVYFGIFNSAKGNGQTLGKRLLKTAVRDENGASIRLGRSLGRALILSLPFILNGWALPIFRSSRIFLALQTFLLFGLGSALVYTMIFNRKTRQGIHDLICKSYVLKLSGMPISSLPKTPRIHWVISGVLVGLFLILSGLAIFLPPANLFGSDFSQLQSLQEKLLADPRFFTASVLDQRVFTQQSRIRILKIEVWYKGLPSQDQRTETINSVAKTTLESFQGIDQFDRLSIGVLSKYDLGIAEGHILQGDIQRIEVWRQRVGK